MSANINNVFEAKTKLLMFTKELNAKPGHKPAIELGDIERMNFMFLKY